MRPKNNNRLLLVLPTSVAYEIVEAGPRRKRPVERTVFWSKCTGKTTSRIEHNLEFDIEFESNRPLKASESLVYNLTSRVMITIC